MTNNRTPAQASNSGGQCVAVSPPPEAVAHDLIHDKAGSYEIWQITMRRAHETQREERT